MIIFFTFSHTVKGIRFGNSVPDVISQLAKFQSPIFFEMRNHSYNGQEKTVTRNKYVQFPEFSER